jgi:hypothetical protein
VSWPEAATEFKSTGCIAIVCIVVIVEMRQTPYTKIIVLIDSDEYDFWACATSNHNNRIEMVLELLSTARYTLKCICERKNHFVYVKIQGGMHCYNISIILLICAQFFFLV